MKLTTQIRNLTLNNTNWNKINQTRLIKRNLRSCFYECDLEKRRQLHPQRKRPLNAV